MRFSHERLHRYTSRTNAVYTGYQDDHHLSLNYLSLPSLVRGQVGPAYVEAGLPASLLVGGRKKGTDTFYGWGTYTQEVDRTVTSHYQ